MSLTPSQTGGPASFHIVIFFVLQPRVRRRPEPTSRQGGVELGFGISNISFEATNFGTTDLMAQKAPKLEGKWQKAFTMFTFPYSLQVILYGGEVTDSVLISGHRVRRLGDKWSGGPFVLPPQMRPGGQPPRHTAAG